MSLLNLVKGLFSSRERGLYRYRSGMARAKRKDYPGAILDYTAAIQSLDPSSDVMAMALYNRALAYSAIDQHDKAAVDLTQVLATPGLPENVKLAAEQRRERLRRRDRANDPA